MVKVGDIIIVHGMQAFAFVEEIEYEPETDRTILRLDWMEHGKSRVYLHDEGKIWYKYGNLFKG